MGERQRDSQRPNMSQPGPSPLRQEEKSLSVQESLSEISDSDVAKFPALFGVRTIIKTDPEEARSQLIEAVGYLFLSRMLRSKEAPTGCPPRFYQSVALSVLACFVEDEEIMKNASVLFNIPELLTIIENSDSEEYEDDAMLVNDAYKILTAIVCSQEGREAFIASRGMMVLSSLNIRQSFQDEEALELLLDILTYERDKCWAYHLGNQDLFNLLKKINVDYDHLSGCDDIDVSDIVGTLLDSLPSDLNITGELQSKTQGEEGSGVKTDTEEGVQIGSVIEILPICDHKRTYLTLLHFDRVEAAVNMEKLWMLGTEKLVDFCSWELASENTSPAFQYKLFHCRPSDKIRP